MLQSKSRQWLTEDHVLIIMYNLLCVLNQIHQCNVMHRDIKSANILVDEQCNIKICDFGLARCMVQKPSNELLLLQQKLFEADEQDKLPIKEEITSCMQEIRKLGLGSKKRSLTPTI